MSKKQFTELGKKITGRLAKEIDPIQLYLLQNFPKFSGHYGLFGNEKDIVLDNQSGSLGTYGIFHNATDGDMIYLNADLLAHLKGTKKSINIKNLNIHVPVSKLPIYKTKRITDKLIEIMFQNPFYYLYNCDSFPFFGNTIFCKDIYDFIINWTQFNIGEFSVFLGEQSNILLDSFILNVISKSDIGNIVDFANTKGTILESEFTGSMRYIITHFKVNE